MKGKHFEITLENGHWPMTYKTTEVVHAYECVTNLLDSRSYKYIGDKEGFLMALARMRSGEILSHSALGITVRLADGEV